MNDNFTMKEAVELILGFCKDPHGYWKSEIEESPEAKKFIEAGYTCFSEDNPDLYVLNSNGEVALHEYIEKISKEFICRQVCSELRMHLCRKSVTHCSTLKKAESSS